MASAEERRRQKELEEARKAGLAPAELDEDGKEINPHIPQYMTSAPWYLNKDKPTLQHQRNWNKKEGDDDKWYDRGAKVFQATKWRKGACENCGSISHATKDCLERPRSKGAKWTNKNIAADEKVETLNISAYDAKRDRWNGYDAKDYNKVVDRFDQLEQLRKEAKAKEEVKLLYGEAKEKGEGEDGAGGEGGDEGEADDDIKIAEEEEAGFGDVKKRVRTAGGGSTGSVRNLRIREDTAKYLLNLDANSAYYDPKTRSMREDPNPEKPAYEKTFQGDNFVRKSGDYVAWQNMQMHALTAYDKGQDVHTHANPSLAEMLYKQFKDKKESLTKASTEDIATKYGDAAERLPEDVRALAATERYVEYDRMGRVVKGQENKIRSRYEEDVYVNNHKAVWGSWWRDGQWGFACCHQTVKNSYCTGKAGEAAVAETGAQQLLNLEAHAARAKEEEDKKRKESKLNDYKGYMGDKTWGDAGPEEGQELDPKKVEEALRRLEKREQEALESDASKRKFNSLDAVGGENVSAEEMEAFRLKKARGDDPILAAAKGAAGAGTSGYDLL